MEQKHYLWRQGGPLPLFHHHSPDQTNKPLENLLEKITDLNNLLLQGNIMDAFEKYYHEEVVTQENEHRLLVLTGLHALVRCPKELQTASYSRMGLSASSGGRVIRRSGRVGETPCMSRVVRAVFAFVPLTGDRRAAAGEAGRQWGAPTHAAMAPCRSAHG